MKTVKIPESFGSGDITITINGVPTKIPIGIETNVQDKVAKIVEKMIRDRTLESLTEEEIKEKERQAIGAVGEQAITEIKESISEVKNNPCIKTLWTGCCLAGTELKIKIPKEMFYNNEKSLVVMIHIWDGDANTLYTNNKPIIYGFSFGDSTDDKGSYGDTPTIGATYGYIANYGEEEKRLITTGINFDGKMQVMMQVTGDTYLYYRNDRNSITTTAISVMRGSV